MHVSEGTVASGLRVRLRALTAIASTLREGASQERDTALSKRS